MANSIQDFKPQLASLAVEIQNSEEEDAPLDGQLVIERVKNIFNTPGCEERIQEWAALALKLNQKKAELLTAVPLCFQTSLSKKLSARIQCLGGLSRFSIFQQPLKSLHEELLADVDEKAQATSALQKGIDRRTGNKSKRTRNQAELISQTSKTITQNQLAGKLFQQAGTKVQALDKKYIQLQKKMLLFHSFMELIEKMETIRVDLFIKNGRAELLFDDAVQRDLDVAIYAIPQEKAQIDQSCFKRLFCCVCRIWNLYRAN